MAQDAGAAAESGTVPAPETRDPDTVYLQADEFINDEENGRYIARGDVEAFSRGRIVRADEVEYYPAEERLVAQGGVTIVEPDGSIEFADSADMTNGLQDAVAVDFSIRMANGALITAAYLERSEGTQNLLTRATYSPCPVCEDDPTPTWRFRARKALQDTEDQMVYYRDVTFELAGVPILYSPFFAHADPSVNRKSGPLLPMVGFSNLTGAEYEQPYFWAIDEHQDLTITPRVMSDVSPLIGLNYRRRFHSGFVEFDATGTQERRFDSSGAEFGNDIWRGSILGRGVFAIDEDWSWGFGVERQTDTEYLLRYNLDYPERNGLYTGERRALLNQLFAAGQDEDFYASVSAVEFQSIRLAPDDQLPHLLPIAEYRQTFDLNRFGRVEAVGDVAFLQRDDGVDYARFTSVADWRRRFVTDPGVVVEFLGRGRGDIYRIDDAFDPATGAPKEGGASRLSGYGAADVSWPFYRPGRVALTVVPRIQFVGSAGDHYALGDFTSEFAGGSAVTVLETPGGDPITLLEDSLTAELNGSNLFALDRYPGYDLIETGFRANAGVTVRADWARASFATLTVGQSFRTDPEIFTAASGLDDEASDYVVEGEVASGIVAVRTSLRIDPDDYELERLEVNGNLEWGPFRLRGNYINFNENVTGYGEREYITAYAEVRLTNNLALGGLIGRDIERGQTRNRSAQLRYYDDCFSIAVVYSQYDYQNTTIGSSQAVSITFSLLTLGNFGTDTRDLVSVY